MAARMDYLELLERERWERDAALIAKADELAAKVTAETVHRPVAWS